MNFIKSNKKSSRSVHLNLLSSSLEEKDIALQDELGFYF